MVTWENSQNLGTPLLVSPQTDVWKWLQKFHTGDVVCHYPDLSSASDCNFPFTHDHLEALPRTRYWHLNSMKFLQSFLRRHFTGTQVVVSQNNSCFLRLFDGCSVQLMQGCHTAALFLMTPLYGDKLWWVEGTSPYKMWWTVYVRNNKLASIERVTRPARREGDCIASP